MSINLPLETKIQKVGSPINKFVTSLTLLFNASIKRAKKEFYSFEINHSSNNSYLMWNTLRHILPSKSNHSNMSDLDPEKFNDFFCSVGQRLTNHFTGQVTPADSIYASNNLEQTFHPHEININNVLKQLLSWPKQSSLDVLGFDSALLRMSALVIAPSLTHIFNLSLCHSQISDWMVAHVTPIYKGSGNKSDPNFYRPISVICSVPKLLEKEVKNQLANYLSDNSLVSPSQSAYLKYHSTQLW